MLKSIGLKIVCMFKALSDTSLDFFEVQEKLSHWAWTVSYISETGLLQEFQSV